MNVLLVRITVLPRLWQLVLISLVLLHAVVNRLLDIWEMELHVILIEMNVLKEYITAIVMLHVQILQEVLHVVVILDGLEVVLLAAIKMNVSLEVEIIVIRCWLLVRILLAALHVHVIEDISVQG